MVPSIVPHLLPHTLSTHTRVVHPVGPLVLIGEGPFLRVCGPACGPPEGPPHTLRVFVKSAVSGVHSEPGQAGGNCF